MLSILATTIENQIVGFCAVAIGFLVFWVLICALCHYSSGWSQFRKLYGVDKVSAVKSWPFQSAQFIAPFNLFGFLGIYRNTLTFGYCDGGIMVSGGPIAPFHQPFVIPWEDAILTVIDGYCLSSVRLPEISIMISKRTYDALMESGRIKNQEGLGI